MFEYKGDVNFKYICIFLFKNGESCQQELTAMYQLHEKCLVYKTEYIYW